MLQNKKWPKKKKEKGRVGECKQCCRRVVQVLSSFTSGVGRYDIMYSITGLPRQAPALSRRVAHASSSSSIFSLDVLVLVQGRLHHASQAHIAFRPRPCRLHSRNGDARICPATGFGFRDSTSSEVVFLYWGVCFYKFQSINTHLPMLWGIYAINTITGGISHLYSYRHIFPLMSDPGQAAQRSQTATLDL